MKKINTILLSLFLVLLLSVPSFAIDWTAYMSNSRIGYVQEQASLYDGAVATDNGEWFSTAGMQSINNLTTIETTATVSIDGSNETTVPSNATDGIPIVSDVTATGFTALEVDDLPRWIKIHIHAWTAGDVDVDVVRGRLVN